jgi:hypothetical protein
MRILGTPGIALAILLVAATARAGSVVHASLAPGLDVGPLYWDGPSAFAPSEQIHLHDRVVSPTIALDVLVGAELSPRTVLGVELEAAALVGGTGRLGQTSFGPAYEIGASLQAGLRTARGVWRFGAGVAMSGFLELGRNALGSADNVVEAERLLGPMAQVSYGWMVSRSLGLAVEARAGYLFAEHLKHVPVWIRLRLDFGAL